MIDLETVELRQAAVQTLEATTETLHHLVLVDVPALVARVRDVELVVPAWLALQRCNDEFLPEYPGSCAEYQDAFDEAMERLVNSV